MTIIDRLTGTLSTEITFRAMKQEHNYYTDVCDPFRRVLRPYVIMEVAPGLSTSILVDSNDQTRRFMFWATARFACWRITRHIRRQAHADQLIDAGLFRYVPRRRRGTKVRLNWRTLRWEFYS